MLRTFFSRRPRKEPPKTQQTAQEQTEVPYNPGLIPALTHQHRALVMLLLKAKTAAQQQRFDEVKEALRYFKDQLEDHLKQESEELHPYLTAHLKGEGGREILKEMRATPTLIRQTVSGFLSHYSGYPVTERNAAHFDVEIQGVSEEFSERIEKEEAAIYTLYMPPEIY